MFYYASEYRFADAAVRSLHMEQGGNGGSNVGHFALSRGTAVAYAPTMKRRGMWVS